MNLSRAEPEQDIVESAEFDNRNVWTVPNMICLVRMIGSLVLIGIAIAGLPHWFIGVYVLLCLSDWIDGTYARSMHQRSPLGARLDSMADALLNACLMIGVLIICWDVVRHELILITTAIGSYFISSLVALAKYKRLPAYHSYSAKITQVLTMIAAISLVLGWSVWPLRITAIAVMLTNLEAIGITYALSHWRADVLSLFHVWPGRDQAGE